MIALRYFLGRDCPIRRQAIAPQPSGPREARSRARESPRAGLDGENDGVKLKDSANPPFFGLSGAFDWSPVQGGAAIRPESTTQSASSRMPATGGLAKDGTDARTVRQTMVLVPK